MRVRLAALILMLGFANSILANIESEEVIVIGNPADARLKASQVDLEAATSFVKVIDRSEFESRFTNLADILDKEIGVQIKQIGGVGSFSAVSVRGATGKQINIFLDGVLLNSAQGGVSDISLIPLNSIERIEIYPDYTPIQLGNANLSGAINIVTHQSLDEEYQASVAVGSFGSQKGSFLAAGSSDKWSYSLALESLEADNDYDVVLRRGNSEERLNSEAEQLSAFFKLGYLFSDHYSLTFTGQHVDLLRGVPNVQNFDQYRTKLHDQVGLYRLGLDADYMGLTASHELVYQEAESVFDQTENTESAGRDWLQNFVEKTGLINHWLLALDDHDLRFSVEYSEEDYKKTNLKDSEKEIENLRKKWVLAVQDTWFLFDGDLNVTSNWRKYQIKDSAELFFDGKAGFSEEDIPLETVETNQDTLHLGLNYYMNSGLKLKANVARAIRAPTMLELFGQTGQMVGEPELTSEKSINFDIGFVYDGRGITSSLAFYIKEIDDAIALFYGGLGQAKPQNIAEVTLQGLEGELKYKPNSIVLFEFGFDLLGSEINTPEKARDGNQMPGIYHDNTFAAVALEFDQWGFRVSYQLNRDMFYDTTERDAADDREQFDASVNWLLENISVNVSVDNVTDQRFNEFNRFSNIGRSYSASINYKW